MPRAYPAISLSVESIAGSSAAASLAFLDWDRLGKRFYLLDTFRGLDERDLAGDEARRKNAELIASGFYTTDAGAVPRNFSEWPNAIIVEGTIPDTLPMVEAREIAFLHIDLNCSPHEVAALEYFWDRLVPGAPVLLDDYAYYGYREQKVAIDQLALRMGVPVVSLPTGQGLAIKG